MKAICEEWKGRGGKWTDKKFAGAEALGKLKFAEGREISGAVEWRRFEQMGTVCVRLLVESRLLTSCDLRVACCSLQPFHYCRRLL